MITKKHTALVAFAACAVALAALGSAKNPVERPFKGNGHVTVVVTLATGDFVSQDWGEATHGGRFTNQGAGNLVTGESHGTATTANGDQVFWKGTGPNSIVWTGGTGRFEGTTGGFTYVSSAPVITYPDANTMVMTYTYTAVGTITY